MTIKINDHISFTLNDVQVLLLQIMISAAFLMVYYTNPLETGDQVMVAFATAVVPIALGAAMLMRGASGVALFFRLSAFVVAALVLAPGTSVPEAFTTSEAIAFGNYSIGYGNIVGSNIANLGIVLAFVATFFGAPVDSGARRSRWMFILVGAVIISTGLRGQFTWLEAGIGTIGFVVFIGMGIFGPKDEVDTDDVKSMNIWLSLVAIACGIVFLYLGSSALNESSVAAIYVMNLSQGFVGTFMQAIATSLPEIMVTLFALFQGNREGAVGNVLGSNIANVTALVAGYIRNGGGFEVEGFGMASVVLLFMTAVAFISLSRKETDEMRWLPGILLGGAYIVFTFASVA